MSDSRDPDRPPRGRSRRDTTFAAAAVLATAVAVGALLAWLAWPTPAPTNPQRTAAPRTLDAASAVADERSGDAPAATPTAPRVGVAPQPPPTPAAAATARTVRIVDEHGAPVAGARVQWTAGTWPDQHLGFAPFDVEDAAAGTDTDANPGADAAGPTTPTRGAPAAPAAISDANGLAVLVPRAAGPAPDQPGHATIDPDATGSAFPTTGFVWARAGERFGQAQLALADAIGTPELEVAPDAAIHATVRGPRGEAFAHVPVVARFRAAEPDDPDGFAEVELGRSRADGGITLHHAQSLRAWSRARPQLALRAIVCGDEPAWHELPSLAAAGAIDLPCPPHGAARVHFPTAADAAAARFEHATPPLAAATERERARNGDDLPPCVVANAPAALGAAATTVHLHPLALGLHWRAASHGYLDATFAGPVAQGQTIDVHTTARTDLATLRVLAPDGAPCAGRTLQLAWRERDGARYERFGTSPPTVVADADGVVRVLGRDDAELRIVDAAARAEAIVDVPVLPGGRGFVGTVQLRAQSVLATGRVVDATTGAAVATTLVAIDPQTWQLLAWQRTAADGSFTLHGEGAAPFLLRFDGARLRPWTTPPADASHPPPPPVPGAPRGWPAVAASGRTPLPPPDDRVLLEPSDTPRTFAVWPDHHLAIDLLVDDDVPLQPFVLRVGDHYPHHARNRAGRRDAALFFPGTLPDPVLTVAAAAGLPTLAAVPFAAWQPVDGGFRVVVDLRGRIAFATVEARCGGERVDCFVWSADGAFAGTASTGLRAVLPLDGAWPVVLAGDAHGVVAATLRPGHQVVELPPPAVLTVHFAGDPTELPAGALTVELLRFARREPELDAARPVALDLWGWSNRSRLEPGTWPLDDDQYSQHDGDSAAHPVAGGAPHTFALARRGSYAVAPVVVRGERRRPLRDYAVLVEVDAMAQSLTTTVQVPPAVVHAAWRALAQ